MVPATVFGLLVAGQATRARAALPALGLSEATVADVLAAANALLLLAYYALVVALYVVRLPPRDSDRRPAIVAASLVATFLVTSVPFLPAAPRRDWLLLPADVLALAGISCAVWSLLFLRRSFSIIPQARHLVTGGPYGLSRNPLYLSEMVGAWAVFLPTMAWPAVLVLAAHVCLQVVRVLAEERILAATFGPGYADYRRRVPRFLPHLWRQRP